MDWPDRERWLALSRILGNGEPAGWYERLTAAYAEPQRHYHNQRHIAACLREFDESRDLAQDPTFVEVAIWFHDAVYDPRANDNEERSADLAVQFLRDARASDEMYDAVRRLILATKTHVARTADEALLIDVDLSILGQSRGRFAEYEAQIRQEYIWVPPPVFAEKRGEILRAFLQRPRIYTTEYFFRRYESSARANLNWSLDQLSPAIS